MKHYNYEAAYQARRKMTPEQSEIAYKKQCTEAFLFVESQLDDVRKVFDVQLKKPGMPEREVAANLIIDYLFQLKKDEFDKTGDESSICWHHGYADSLITVAETVEAANNGDERRFTELLEKLPWGDSNTGDQISYNSIRFVYWILSEEDRKKFNDVFYSYLKKSNLAHNSDEKAAELMDQMDKMVALKDLKEHVEQERQRLNEEFASGSSQPGNRE